jgi:hypothetical protein
LKLYFIIIHHPDDFVKRNPLFFFKKAKIVEIIENFIMDLPYLWRIRQQKDPLRKRNRSFCKASSGFTASFSRGELILADSTERTFKVLREVFKLSAGSNSVIGIAFSLVISPATDITYILHTQPSSHYIFAWNGIIIQQKREFVKRHLFTEINFAGA